MYHITIQMLVIFYIVFCVRYLHKIGTKYSGNLAKVITFMGVEYSAF